MVRSRKTLEAQGSEFDLSREIASMFVLALQRNREGRGSKEEVHEKDSKRMWWTKKERWGGGPTNWGQLACEVYEDEDPSWSPEEKELQVKKKQEAQEEMERFAEVDKSGKDVKVEDLIAGSQTKPEKAGREEREPPKKKNRIEIPDRPRRSGSEDSRGDGERGIGKARTGNGKKKAEGETREGRKVAYVAPSRRRFFKEWQTVRPNGSTWDEKVIWKRIGRPTKLNDSLGETKTEAAPFPDDQFDEIFQVTSVNHHVAIMKMRISKRYLHWLETGEAEKREQGNEEDVLKVWRSQWFDMF